MHGFERLGLHDIYIYIYTCPNSSEWDDDRVGFADHVLPPVVRMSAMMEIKINIMVSAPP